MLARVKTKSWSDFYKERVGDSYARYVEKRYYPYLRALLSLPHTTRREEGCGIGTITKILNWYKPSVTEMFDLCGNMVELARYNTGISSQVSIDDIRTAKREYVDLIYSHGVLEHFDLEDIKKILKRQLLQAKYVVHYVPTDGYAEPSFGDERLMSYDWWLVNTNPWHYYLFNDEKDLVLVYKSAN